MQLFDLGKGPMEGFCEHGKLDCMKVGEFRY
jgi:hypothetical protein